MVQNHALQLVCLTAMEPPVSADARQLRDEKVKVLRAIRRIDAESAVLGQYRGYLSEKGVARDSKVPTYVAFRLFVDNWRWHGVPFYVRTGKKLAAKVTDISLKFKRVPHLLFKEDKDVSPNMMSICVEPDEGIHLQFEVQSPGMEMKTTRASLGFHYSSFGESVLPKAYERLLLDAIVGDQSLFAREDEVEHAWRVVEPLLSASDHPDKVGSGLRLYRPGSWGPPEASGLLEKDGRKWDPACIEESHRA
jgi:glucose-6-phosphate 1-dehydrogenase